MAKRLPYWNLDRMREVHETLRCMSKPQNNTSIRVIRLEVNLKWAVFREFLKKDPEVSSNLVGHALDLFAKMEIINIGRQGTRKPGFPRFFNPNIELTQELLDEARAKTKH